MGRWICMNLSGVYNKDRRGSRSSVKIEAVTYHRYQGERMLALKVLDVKNCMNDLLASEAFDRFLLSDATITTRMTYSLDGHLTKGYLTEEELLRKDCPGSAVCLMAMCANCALI